MVLPALFSDSQDPRVPAEDIQRILFDGPSDPGTVTEFYSDLSGGRLQITDAFYTGPDRKPLNSSLIPDVRVRPNLDEEDPSVDVVLERSLKVLLGEEEIEEEAKAA